MVFQLWKDLMKPYHGQMAKVNITLDYIYDNYTHSLPFGTAALYLVMVFVLPAILKPRDGSKSKPPGKLLKLLMALWNLFLSVGSAVMITGILTGLLDKATTAGFMATVCDRDGSLLNVEPLVFWANIFVWSKYAELVDTLFLIIKNPDRPVPFLHYYHHATVLLFTWYAIVMEFTVGIWFGVINGFVHTIMYFYYFLTELGYRPSWAIFITVIQISQMVIGIALNITWARSYLGGAGCTCKQPENMLWAALAMYASYLFLFVRFFIKRYFGSGTPRPSSSKPQSKKD